MFQVITPLSGDKIFFGYTSGLSQISDRALVERIVIKSGKRYGIHPINRQKDMFGNQSCFHLNIMGTLFAGVYANAPRISLGSVYLDPACTTLMPLGMAAKFAVYSGPITGFLFRGIDEFDEGPPIYKKGSSYTVKTVQSARYVWLTTTKLRVELRTYATRTDTGAVTIDSLTCWYYQYNFKSTFATYRSKSVTITPFKNGKIVSWISPTTSFYSMSKRHVLTVLSEGPKIDLDEFRRRLSTVIRDSSSEDSSSFGKLTLDASQGLRVIKVNIYTFLIEMEWITKVADYVQKLKSVESFLRKTYRIDPKLFSAAYLSSKYGIKLTYLDVQALLGPLRSSVGMRRDVYTTSRARTSLQLWSSILNKSVVVNNVYNMKMYCARHPNDFVAAMAQLMVSGVYPLTETVWDVVPFSFVIDWFVRVSDVLKTIDAKTLYKSYHLLSSVYSCRSTFHVPISELFPEWSGTVSGLLTVVYYRRYVSKEPPPISLSYQTPQSFSHWVEAAALIVQQL